MLAIGVDVLWLGVNLGVLGCCCVPAAGVVAAEDGAEMDGAGVLAAEEEARRLGGNPVPGVLEGVLLVAPAGVLEGVLPFAAEPPLGVSYAPAISPPATGVRPPPLLLLFPADLPPADGLGVRTVLLLSAGLPNETADSDRLGGAGWASAAAAAAAAPESSCPDLSPLDAMMTMNKAIKSALA